MLKIVLILHAFQKKKKEKNVVMSNEHPLASKNNVQERDTNTRKIQSNTNAPPILDCTM